MDDGQHQYRRWFAALLLVAFVAHAVAHIVREARVISGDPTGLPALHAAVVLDDRTTVARLLDDGVPVNDASGPEGNTPIHYARSGSMVEFLIKHGADPYFTNKEGETPLHNCHMPGAARALLAAGADPDSRDDSGEVPLHDVPNGKLVRILAKAGADIDALDIRGLPPIYTASNAGVAAELLARGADPKAGRNAVTAMHHARDDEVVRLLLEAGLAVDDATSYGHQPLHTVRHAAAATALIANGADIEAKSFGSGTPLVATLSLGVAQALLDAGADMEAMTRGGHAKLEIALRSGQEGIAQELLKRGAVLPQPGSWARVRDSDTIRALLRAGAPAATIGISGLADPLLVAELLAAGALAEPAERAHGYPLGEAPSVEIAALLLKAGADPNSSQARWGTALAAHLRSKKMPELEGFIDLLLPVTDLSAHDHLVYCSDLATVSRFIKAGADPNTSSLFRWMVGRSRSKGDEAYQIVESLIAAGADLNADDGLELGGASPALLSVSSIDMVNLLLAKGADPAQTRADGTAVLHNSRLSPDAVSKLIAVGADPNAQSSRFGTPIEVLRGRIRIDSIFVLLQHGTDPNRRFRDGRTPMHWIVDSLHESPRGPDREVYLRALRALLAAGADPSIPDRRGRLVDDYSRDRGVLEALRRHRKVGSKA